MAKRGMAKKIVVPLPGDPDFKCGEEHYIASGRPLFSKLWTYKELMNVERPRNSRRVHPGQDGGRGPPMETPEDWPEDTVVDTTSKWVFWLPDGWMQGIRTTAAGKTLKCYMSPEARRFWHKKDIEKYLGRELPKVEPLKMTTEDGEVIKRTRYVSDSDAIPHWPDEDWLPKDWRIAIRQLPSGLHTVYVPPGQDEGFCYHRSSVIDYISGTKMTTSRFDTSRLLTDPVGGEDDFEDEEELPEQPPPPPVLMPPPVPRKKARKNTTKKSEQFNIKDYEQCDCLVVAEVPPLEMPADEAEASLLEAGAGKASDILEHAKLLRAALVKRHFPDHVDLLVVTRRPREASEQGLGERPGERMAHCLSGFFYKLPDLIDGRACYQYVYVDEKQVYNRGQFIFWSEELQRWQIGYCAAKATGLPEDDELSTPGHRKAGLAFSLEPGPTPQTSGSTWMTFNYEGMPPIPDEDLD